MSWTIIVNVLFKGRPVDILWFVMATPALFIYSLGQFAPIVVVVVFVTITEVRLQLPGYPSSADRVVNLDFITSLAPSLCFPSPCFIVPSISFLGSQCLSREWWHTVAVAAACPDTLQRNCVVVICSNNGTGQVEDHMLSQNYDVTSVFGLIWLFHFTNLFILAVMDVWLYVGPDWNISTRIALIMKFCTNIHESQRMNLANFLFSISSKC